MNLLNYIDTIQEKDFNQLPLGEIDFLSLAELSYLPFDNLVNDNWNPLAARELGDILDQIPYDSSPLMKERYLLLPALARSKRYKNLSLIGFEHILNPDQDVQFSATTFMLNSNTFVIAFRGTDDSLVGWKEDFMMSYQEEVPAQALAVEYLKKALQEIEGTVYLTGHSKGGNLVSYSLSQVPSHLQEKVTAAYSFDGPGLHTKILSRAGYQAIHKKLHRYIPENSAIGILLYSQAPAQIIKSTARTGLQQHNTFTWKIKEHSLVRATQLSKSSRHLERTISRLVKQVPSHQLEAVVTTFFSLLEEQGIDSINVFLQGNVLIPLGKVIQAGQHIDPKERDLLIQFAQIFFQISQGKKYPGP